MRDLLQELLVGCYERTVTRVTCRIIMRELLQESLLGLL